MLLGKHFVFRTVRRLGGPSVLVVLMLMAADCRPAHSRLSAEESEDPAQRVLHADCELSHYEEGSPEWKEYRHSYVIAFTMCEQQPLEVHCDSTAPETGVPVHEVRSLKNERGLVRISGTYSDIRCIYEKGLQQENSLASYPCEHPNTCVKFRLPGASKAAALAPCHGKRVVVEGWFDPCLFGYGDAILGEICPRRVQAISNEP